MKSRDVLVAGASLAGLYVSQHMYRKALRAQRGELTEPSIVETPAATIFFGQPNALYGLIFYGVMLASTPFTDSATVRLGRKVATGLAASSSLYLMYSLLFITKMECPYCWTGHGLNMAILATIFTE
jgi:uncharacterized membrane protein